MTTIVIKLDLRVDLVNESYPVLHGLTRVKPEKLKKIYLRF